MRILLLLMCLLSLPAPVLAQDAKPEPPSAVISLYDEGKRAYDAADYQTALRKFNQAIRLDPTNPRWHYNIGLTHRQLENFAAASDAFRQAQQLDPNYKRAEIADKLAAMGVAKAGGPSRLASHGGVDEDQGSKWVPLVAGLGVLVGVVGFVVMRRKRARASTVPPADPAQVQALEARRAKLGGRLVPLEHAMRLGEDADLRNLLDRATDLEQSATAALELAARGDGAAQARAASHLDEAEALASEARQRAIELHGEAAFSGKGERIGCYFCARPLANPEYRKIVPVGSAGKSDDVLACPVCAGAVVRGRVPEVTGSGEGDGFRHWSEDAGFDPYLNRHVPRADMRGEPAWNYRPPQGIGSIALLAAGGALAAGGTAYAATHLLDLDTAREAGLAETASRAAARRASEQKSESRFSDHS